MNDLIRRFFGRLRFPQLVMLFGALFALDLVIPDVIPFIDEIFLALLTTLFASFRSRRDPASAPEEPSVKNITPRR
jgi:Family of unknown function (DUF6116)